MQIAVQIAPLKKSLVIDSLKGQRKKGGFPIKAMLMGLLTDFMLTNFISNPWMLTCHLLQEVQALALPHHQ